MKRSFGLPSKCKTSDQEEKCWLNSAWFPVAMSFFPMISLVFVAPSAVSQDVHTFSRLTLKTYRQTSLEQSWVRTVFTYETSSYKVEYSSVLKKSAVLTARWAVLTAVGISTCKQRWEE